MRRELLAGLYLLATWREGSAHDIGSSPTTWYREISRVFYERCVSCHHPGGLSFSLMTYQDAQPRAAGIKEAVLSRRMPPWGAVKGFGDFRNDQALTEEEVELITDWVEGDTVRGTNPNVLPKAPTFAKASSFKVLKNRIIVKGNSVLYRKTSIDGLLPKTVPERSSVQVVAALPNGDVIPLVWFYEYEDAYRHPFLFRRQLELPAGTEIRGLPADASIILIPGKRAKEIPEAK